MPTKKQRSERKVKSSGQVVGRSLDPVVGPLNWPKTYSIVTGVGSCEWRWSSATKAEARLKNGKWKGPYDGGADLFECLSRKTQRHTIKRVVPNPGVLLPPASDGKDQRVVGGPK